MAKKQQRKRDEPRSKQQDVPEEKLEDLDVPEKEGEDVRGGIIAVLTAPLTPNSFGTASAGPKSTGTCSK